LLYVGLKAPTKGTFQLALMIFHPRISRIGTNVSACADEVDIVKKPIHQFLLICA